MKLCKLQLTQLYKTHFCKQAYFVTKPVVLFICQVERKWDYIPKKASKGRLTFVLYKAGVEFTSTLRVKSAALMLSFSTSLLATEAAVHWMTTKLVHPGRKLPVFPKDVSTGFTAVCECVCLFVFLKQKEERGASCVNSQFIQVYRKPSESLILILAACFNL